MIKKNVNHLSWVFFLDVILNLLHLNFQIKQKSKVMCLYMQNIMKKNTDESKWTVQSQRLWF